MGVIVRNPPLVGKAWVEVVTKEFYTMVNDGKWLTRSSITYAECDLVVWGVRPCRRVGVILPEWVIVRNAKESDQIHNGIVGVGTGVVSIPFG